MKSDNLFRFFAPLLIFNFFLILQSAQAAGAKPQAPAADNTVPLFDSAGPFMEAYTGYDYSFLGDIVKGTKAWVSYAKAAGYTGSAWTNNCGILAGALFGLRLDRTNSLALDLGGVFPQATNSWSMDVPLTVYGQNCSSTLLNALLDYKLNLIHSPGDHTYLTLGAGWYHAIVFNSLVYNNSLKTGTYTGDILGGALGIGEEISFGGSFGLDIWVRGRYATFNQVSSPSANTVDSVGPASMAMQTTTVGGDHYTLLLPYTNAYIAVNPSTLRNASVDFSGIDAHLAFAIYF